MKYLLSLQPPNSIHSALTACRASFGSRVREVSRNNSHVSLMVLRSDVKNEDAMLRTLCAGGARFSKFRVFLGDLFPIDVGGSREGIAVRAHGEYLASLHEYVTDSLSGFIDKESTLSLPSQFSDDSNRRRVHAVYGSPFYREFYSPHLSVARLHSLAGLKLDDHPNPLMGFSWVESAIVVSRKESDGSWSLVDRLVFDKK